MLTLDSALIKNDVIIKCKYYELEKNCIEIVNNYCNESEANRIQFEEFAEKYKTFRPYFDFVICVLGYQVENAQMEENTLLVGKKNHMYVYKKIEKRFENNFRYGMSDEETLNIYPMSLDSSTFHDCLIDGNNNHILPNDMFGHVQILQQILNLLLISNKEICEEYLHYTSDVGFFVQRYLPIIRFQADKQGRMIITRCFYREDNLTELQNDFINYLLDNRLTYPSFLLKVNEEDNHIAVDLSNEISNCQNMLNESHKR